MRYIEKTDALCKKVDDFYAGKKSKTEYDYPFVREQLESVYGKCCAYCGIRIVESKANIEHFYPKAKDDYKKYRRDFRNLHYSCWGCNQAKLTAGMTHVMSPNYYLEDGVWKVSPMEIREHLHYTAFMLFPNVKDQNHKGLCTIRELKLNKRASLLEERIRKLNEVKSLLEDVVELLENYCKEKDARLEKKFADLVRMVSRKESFSEMVLQNYGENIERLLKVWGRCRGIIVPKF